MVMTTPKTQNPLAEISPKYGPYLRLAKLLEGVCSYGHAHKILKGKYGKRNNQTKQLVFEYAELVAEEIKKEQAELRPAFKNQ